MYQNLMYQNEYVYEKGALKIRRVNWQGLHELQFPLHLGSTF